MASTHLLTLWAPMVGGRLLGVALRVLVLVLLAGCVCRRGRVGLSRFWCMVGKLGAARAGVLVLL